MTSHPSQDVATPVALDHPAFEPPDTSLQPPEAEEDEVQPAASVEADGRQSSSEEKYLDQTSKVMPQYAAHHLPMTREEEPHQDECQDEEAAPSEDRTDAEPLTQNPQNLLAAEQELQCEVGHVSTIPHVIKDLDPTQKHSSSTTNMESPTQCTSISDRASSSPVFRALQRAQQSHLSRGGQCLEHKSNSASPFPVRGQGRGRGVPLQRSSSLPSSVLSPSKVVSSVNIQFRKGQASCTPPQYSFKFTQEAGLEREIEQEEKGGKPRLSTLVLNPASSSGSNKKTNCPSEGPIPPKPIPRYLTRSSYSLQSSSPPPDLSPGGSTSFWVTRSVPDLSTSQGQRRQFEENTETNQNDPRWSPGQMTSPYSNSNHNTPAQYLNPSPSHSPYPMMLNPPLQYPSPLQLYTSLPNLCQYNSSPMLNSPSLTSHHQHVTPTVHQYNSSFLNLQQSPSFSTPPHNSLGNLHFGASLHNPGYNHLSSNQPSQYSTPHGSPYSNYHGYNAFPQPLPQCAPLAPEHNLCQGPAPHPPGFLPGLASSFSSFTSFHSTHTPPAMSSTEMQLRKVLHDIKGTVQSLAQVCAFRYFLRLLFHFLLHSLMQNYSYF